MSVQRFIRRFLFSFAALITAVSLVGTTAYAADFNQLPTPDPIPGSYGLEATKPQPPPKVGATISVPGNGASFTTSPITVSGICPNGLLVQVYDDNVMVGSTMCDNGTFTMQISLFEGQNDLTATDYDDLGQAGPSTNLTTVNYSNTNFSAFGTLITLTSNYGRRAANPGSMLSWPLLVSGGNGPYAFSIDWGDGTPSELKSQALAGTVDISHVYNKSGIYHVVVRVTDVHGITAFLQLIAVANGNVTTTASASQNNSGKNTTTITHVLWLPAVIIFLLMIPVYWLGRRSELVALHNKLEKDAREYNKLDTPLQ
jgi:hypothetical protein